MVLLLFSSLYTKHRRKNFHPLPPGERRGSQQGRREKRGNCAHCRYPNGRIPQTQRAMGSLGYVWPRTISRSMGCTRRACPRRTLRRGCHGPRKNSGG
ncbi:unnamed protein product [Pylaiella littoralis]